MDQYLSSLDMDMFQGVQNRKITREKSPHVSSARGSLCLAKKLNARTQNKDKDPFKWAESDQSKKEALKSHCEAVRRRMSKDSGSGCCC